ncbi:hypothetical protein [Streptacidiphilus carbonis]|uniref:hypothetical protein n=1 Tax=Streptacidiphilus carbonis TaxID=105422 RepID=UPI000A6A9A14|nr:hypothetical protein [Streptacidiphilus carbonis]
MSKKVQQVVIGYVVAHVIHMLFNEEIDALARRRGWSAQQVEFAKIVASGLMLAV